MRPSKNSQMSFNELHKTHTKIDDAISEKWAFERPSTNTQTIQCNNNKNAQLSDREGERERESENDGQKRLENVNQQMIRSMMIFEIVK